MARISDDRVLEVLGAGARTGFVARRLGWQNGTNLARRYLQRLEKQGLVERCPRYTAANDIYWRPVTP